MEYWLSTYGKAIGQGVVAAALAAYTAYLALGTSHLRAADWITVAIAAGSAVGVWIVPVVRGARWAKTAIAALMWALNLAAAALVDGWSTPVDLPVVLAAVLAVAGAHLLPSESSVPDGVRA
jgi:hypothetical protein